MRQLTIVFVIALSSYCGLAKARCLTGDEIGKMFDDCAERASPGISAIPAKVSRVIQALNDYNAKQYGEITDHNPSESIDKIAKVVDKCWGTRLPEASPELGKIWDVCDERSNYQFELRKKCVSEEYNKICPGGFPNRSKRSPIPDLDTLVLSIRR